MQFHHDSTVPVQQEQLQVQVPNGLLDFLLDHV